VPGCNAARSRSRFAQPPQSIGDSLELTRDPKPFDTDERACMELQILSASIGDVPASAFDELEVAVGEANRPRHTYDPVKHRG
jgi:hypothetical protein